jgi:hypothetical protein
MPRFASLLAVVLTASLNPLHAQSASSAADQVVGTWSGTYSGDASGKYTMVLSRDAANKIGGTVEAVADAGNGYKATFKSIVVDGKTVKMAYDDPENAVMEVQLEATVDGNSMTGSWKSVDTGAKSVAATGTFTGSKH